MPNRKANKKPVTFKDLNKSYKFDWFLDRLDDLKWTQVIFIAFIIGPVLFLIWLLRDTFLNYKKQSIEKKRKSRHKKRRKRKGHRRLIEE